MILVGVLSLAALRAPLARVHEQAALQSGHALVAGIDEAGVGTIAGPLVAVAVMLPPEGLPLYSPVGRMGAAEGRAAAAEGLLLPPADAKSLRRRERRDECLRLDRTDGLVWGCAILDAAELDALGSARAATEVAMRRAAARLEARLARGGVHYLVDGERVPRGLSGRSLVGGDRLEGSIAAASIFASVLHEQCMRALARRWREWELEVNAGWPSREHLRRIAAHGPCGCHRASCFPFRRRAGRRMSYHPDRTAYAAVQLQMRRAVERAALPDEAADEEGESELDAAERARRRRYRRFAARAAAADVDGGGRAQVASATRDPRENARESTRGAASRRRRRRKLVRLPS